MCQHLLVPSVVRGVPARAAMAIAIVLALAAGTSSRQPPAQKEPQRPVFRAGVSLVRVDVTVTGRDNAPLVDLTPADFVVTEDGAPQTIEQVEFVRLSGSPEAGDDVSLAIRSREHAEAEAAREDVRLFAIFLDDYHIERTPTSTVRLRETLSQFVKEQIKPLDLVAIMDPLTPLSALQFTREREELLRPIRKFEGRRGIYMPPRSVVEEAQLEARDIVRVRAEVTLSALEALVVKLTALREGRKSVLFVSEGPPMFFRDGAIEDLVADVLKAAQRGNVTINVLDPRGLTVGGFGRGNDVLFRLAGDTGGRTIVNTNNWDGGLEGMVQDASAYYLLTYSPAREWADGKFHRIDVRVRRSGARVVARKGYWAPRAEDMVPKPALDVPADVAGATATLTETARPGRPDLWVGLDGSDGRSRLRVSWELTELPTDPSQRPAALRISVRDAVNAEVAHVSVPAEGPSGRGPWQAWLEVPAGAFTLAATLETDQGDILDEWRRPWAWSAPPPGEPQLFTPRVFVARSAQQVRRVLAAEPVPPSAVRVFRRTERVFVAFDVAPEAASPGVEVTLLTREGRLLARLEAQQRQAGAWQFELPVGNLAAGEFTVRVEARLGAWSASEVIAFRMRP